MVEGGEAPKKIFRFMFFGFLLIVEGGGTWISSEDIPIAINILYIAVLYYTISLMGKALTRTFFSYPIL